ncbi:MAG: o-succinylbenzoate synthase [Opitutae bacterium]|nr:o-succinylbenzoate synthase [Opitutae bacterium]
MTYRFGYRSYRLPLRHPLRTAHGLWAEREGLLLRLEDELGRVGYGEVAPISWFGSETLAEAAEVCRALGDKFPAELIGAVASRFGCVRFALALAQETGAAAGVAASARLPVAALLPAGRAALAALPGKIEAGFLAFKWKVGVGGVDEELGLFDDLLALLPAYARLRLDANGAWDRRQAQRWLARCTERPVEFVEQPVAAEDEDTLLGLAGEFPVTLALDESVVRLEDARRWQALGWPGVFVIKPSLCGPLEETKAWIEATKADVVFSSAIETALGRAAILRFALGGGFTKRALGFGVGEIFGDRKWDGPILGPLVDASCVAGHNAEELWNALS